MSILGLTAESLQRIYKNDTIRKVTIPTGSLIHDKA